MAPVSTSLEFLFAPRTAKPSETIPNTFVSSLELDKRSERENADAAAPQDDSIFNVAPIAQHDLQVRTIQARSDSTFVPGQGTQAPESFHNQGFLALFAILGAAMVLASIWFFFWAKNGGFKWQQGDWEDYKSTVLRRKGPDGKTLSNATKSTKLGGGTIVGSQHYAWQKNMAQSVVGRDEKGRKGVLGKRGWAKTHSITYSDAFTDTLGTRTVTDEMTELRSEPDIGHHSRRYRDRDVHQYKKEKPARVGGLNRVADGSHFDYTNTDRSDIMTESVVTESSDQPILPHKTRDDRQRRDKERAERKARKEAAQMERRWKREAEEAAAALARESNGRIPPPPPPAHSNHAKKSSSPSKQYPSSHKPRRDRAPSTTRSNSPRKHRDFSYTSGPESEILSTAYTQSTSQRTASYYDEYRPRASEYPAPPTRYSSEYGEPSSKRTGRQSSPRKKQDGGGRSGGYRRGGTDSDLE